jgi:glycosyltransferase involved in cell wall biosynthesis
MEIDTSEFLNTKPIITIITVVFNSVSHIESTILSVIQQTNHKIYYIIIDGGSTDGTVDIIKKYQNKIHYWISERDKGIYDAFNKGWSVAPQNTYILFLGAGDKINNLPQENVIRNAEVVYGRVMLDQKQIFKSKADFRLRLGNTLHHQALLVKKSLFLEPPFDLRFKTYADFDFNQRLLKRKVKFTFDEKFVAYALPGGVSQKFKWVESLSIVKKNFGIGYSILASVYYFLQCIKNIFKS